MGVPSHLIPAVIDAQKEAAAAEAKAAAAKKEKVGSRNYNPSNLNPNSLGDSDFCISACAWAGWLPYRFGVMYNLY